jgi:hypothetical protein
VGRAKTEPRKRIRVRLNFDEYVDWKHLLSASGLSQTEYMRQLITGFIPRKQPGVNFFLFKKEFTSLINALRRISAYAEQHNLPAKELLRERELEATLLNLDIFKLTLPRPLPKEELLFESRGSDHRLNVVTAMVNLSEYLIFSQIAFDARMEKAPLIRKLIAIHKKTMAAEKTSDFDYYALTGDVRDIGTKIASVETKIKKSIAFDHEIYLDDIATLIRILKIALTCLS